MHSVAEGLSQAAVEARLRKSVLPRSKPKFLKEVTLFLGQFKSPLMLLLLGAVIIAGILGDVSDVIIILFIVASTGLLSFFQERNAGRVVEKLRSMTSLNTTVLRDGKPQELVSTLIVQGDIILVKAGDLIPADCLIFEAEELQVNESSLTGESYPVRKAAGVIDEHAELAKRANCLWEGCNIVSGTGKALVINLGADTLFGSIAGSASTSVETAFEHGIKDFGFLLMKISLIFSAFVLAINLFNHKSVIESALFALSIAVGMAPELLPAITTIAMSAGAKRLLAKKVIVKKLTSIQNLGEVNLLCTDKTGTITEGTTQVKSLVDASGVESVFVKELAYWNAFFETGYANPIDEALKKLTVDTPSPKKWGEIPYDFTRKRLSIATDNGTEKRLVSKGAFVQILSICSQMRRGDGSIADLNEHRSEIQKKYEQYGLDGLRCVGVCYKTIGAATISKEMETSMIFAGFLLLEDPVKAGIKETRDELGKLQVALKIITGDNQHVARSIALSIGLEPVIMTGEEVSRTRDEDLPQLAKQTNIFAEVEPQHKEKIIRALRKSFTVAYVGDGINDVPAINAADVGISVENAVDVMREAADFVLTEKSLMVVVDGIKEGRKTFANTLKYIFINTGSTFGTMFSVAVASLTLPFLPLLPKQILLINFITDFPYLAIASDNVDAERLQVPGKWNLKFIRNYMIIFGLHSSFFDMISFLTLFYFLKAKESVFQTGWFIESAIAQLLILFIVRTRNNFFKSKPGKYLFVLSMMGFVIAVLLPYSPLAKSVGLISLPPVNLSVMLLIVAVYIVTADLLKAWFFSTYKEA